MQRPGTPESRHGSGEEGKGRLGGGPRGAPAVESEKEIDGALCEQGRINNGQ